MEVASGTASLKVRVEVSSKVKAEAEAGRCCDCAEGTETKVDAGCVSFRQAFGRTPLLAGMPVGALAIEEEVFDEALFTPAALRYDHPMMRRLDPETRLVTTPMGWTIAYGADGFPIDTDVALDSRLEEVAGETQEVFADRSRVAYDAAGKVSALISPRGVRVPVDELGISVERDAAGNIARVESVADGTLEVAVTSPTAYTVSWTNAEGGGEKSFAFAKEGEDTLLLMDGPFPVRWRWVPEARDFAMTLGEGDEAATTARTVAYAGETVRVAKQTSRAGVVAAAETQFIDAKNGNAVVGRSVGVGARPSRPRGWRRATAWDARPRRRTSGDWCALMPTMPMGAR